MKRFLQTQFLFVVIAVLLAGCLGTGPMPETNNERLALIEISYGALLDKATLYANEGRLSVSQISKLDKSFDEIEKAIRLAKDAMVIADQLTFDNSTKIITSSLSIVRTLLVELE